MDPMNIWAPWAREDLWDLVDLWDLEGQWDLVDLE